MSVSTATVCNICGTQKREVNHWFRCCGGSTGLLIWPADGAMPYTAGLEADSIEDLCGAGCAQKRLAAWLGEKR